MGMFLKWFKKDRSDGEPSGGAGAVYGGGGVLDPEQSLRNKKGHKRSVRYVIIVCKQ